MKSSTKTLAFVATLSLITFSLNCSSLASPSQVPSLENRTLRISLSKASLEYRYEVCVKHFLGICTKKKWQTDEYDLTDGTVRKMLIDKGFVAKVRERL